MAFSYRKFLNGLRIKPKTTLVNSEKGDLEVSDVDNKLYYFNGSVNSPVQTEASALSSTFTTLTGSASVTAVVQSALNQNLSLQAQGSGSVALEEWTVQGSTLTGGSSSTALVQSATNQNLSLQAQGIGVVNVESLSVNGAVISSLSNIVISASGTNTVTVEGIAFQDNNISGSPGNEIVFISGVNLNSTISTQFTDVASVASLSAVSTVASFIRLTGTTATTLQGLTPGTISNGKRIVFFNATNQDLTIAHQSASDPTPANRIITPTGASVTVSANSAVELIYDAVQSRWVFVSASSSGGTETVTSVSSGPYTALANDTVILVTTGATNLTVNLPAAASSNRKIYVIKKVDSGIGSVVIQANGAETIDGTNVQLLFQQWESVRIVSNGTSWSIL